MLWSLPLALYIHHNQMPHVSNPQKLRIFWQRAVLEKNIPTLTHPTLERAWFCLSTWDPCVFEQNFDIKKQLRLRPGDCGFSNVKTKCDESTNYYYVSWKVLFNPANLSNSMNCTLEHIHLITNLKRMLFLNLINCTWFQNLKECYANPVLPGVFCI